MNAGAYAVSLQLESRFAVTRLRETWNRREPVESIQGDATRANATSTHGNPRARQRSKLWVLLGVGVLLVLAVINGSMRFFDDGLPTEVDGTVRFDGLTSSVVPGPVDYELRPPAGGPHAALLQECGVYRVPVTDENAVASLATGAIWIAYNPEIAASDIELLEEVALGEREVILAPYPGLNAPVIATAWGVQLVLDDPRDRRVPLFMTVYANQDSAPDPTARCVPWEPHLPAPSPARRGGGGVRFLVHQIQDSP